MADQTGHQILVADDSPMIALMLQETLTCDGQHVTLAADGEAALACIAAAPPDLILLDLDMPRLSGYEVCRRVKQNPATRLIPVVILTGQSAAEARLRAWELGADDFLTKPFQCVEILARCRSLLRVKCLIDELDSATAVVFALARAVEAKSPYTQGHAERVAGYALALAVELGVSAEEQDVLRAGAILHDIGKISIPDAILDKPGPLTAAELAIVRQHPTQGAHIVESLRSIRTAVPLIRWHHERLDGAGYPDGLSGSAIPLLVRILSVCDVYDALSSARPYRSAIPHGRCLELLHADAASGGLDPELVKVFCMLDGLGGLAQPCGAPAPRSQTPEVRAALEPVLTSSLYSHDLA